MGTTAYNLHVRIGGTEISIETLAASISEPAWIAPELDGWASVYPDSEEPTAELARSVARKLNVVTIAIESDDSDSLVATVSWGELTSTLICGWPEQLDYLDLIPGGDPIWQGEHQVAYGDLMVWAAILGGSTDTMAQALAVDNATPFAEQGPFAMLKPHGLGYDRLAGGPWGFTKAEMEFFKRSG